MKWHAILLLVAGIIAVMMAPIVLFLLSPFGTPWRESFKALISG